MTIEEIKPNGPLVAWYGDDFTGAAAVMEVLTFAGLPSVHFFDVPSVKQLAKFPGIRGVGVASTASSMPPEWRQENLPRDLSALAKLGNGIAH